ncbi:UDP-2,3-diacylglucosamine diphosphatase [candidate division CSSED10-310 bacterium]|uniref:UDP-2,3-diacylglucosamine diphosphatase n=1 Tax=candidate division CSSED10-310 bacterium TaxID=2855610 RepID=A0ABV6YV51_UNCC1
MKMAHHKATIFLSDAHLNDSDPIRQERLVNFLKKQTELDRLYIVGDLFDFWFGYKTVIFRYYIPILCQLYRLHEQGCEIVYVLGNHDFYLGPLFRETIPMRIVPADSIELIGDKKVYVVHGDGINKSDYGYRFLRFMVRSKMVQILFKWIHPDIGWFMAKLLSRSSRSYRNLLKCDREIVYLDYGLQKIKEGADVCIMAHSHFPLIKKYELSQKSGLVINIGDWMDNLTYLEYTAQDGFKFYQYQGENRIELQPETVTAHVPLAPN